MTLTPYQLLQRYRFWRRLALLFMTLCAAFTIMFVLQCAKLP
jgi:hypothetical protein